MERMIGSFIGLFATTFLLAMIYGLYISTTDFLGTGPFDPVASGRSAGTGVYSLFGETAGEIAHEAPNTPPKTISALHRIAVPYAVTADLSALLSGKLELGLSHLMHGAEKTVSKATANIKTAAK